MGNASRATPVVPSERSKWIVLATVSIGTLMSTLDGGMVGVSFPALSTAFKTDTSVVLWVSVAFWITNFGLLPILGWLGDVHGRKRVYVAGSLIFAIAIIAASMAPNIWSLIAIRTVQAVGSAMVLSNLNALIADSFSPTERGKAMGLSGAVVGAGLSVGPLAGGFLLDVLGWQSLFYSRAPIGVLGAWLAWYMLPPDRPQSGRFKVDFLGSSVLFATLASFLLMINQIGRIGIVSPLVLGLSIATISMLPVLIWTERRSTRPILEVSLFKKPNYTIAILIQISHYVSHGGIILVAPFFFIDYLSFSPTKMGTFIAAFYLTRTAVAPLAGWLSDRFGPRPFLLVGNSIFALALLWISKESVSYNEVTILAALLLAGTGSAFFEPVVTSVIMSAVPQDRLGTASASVAMGRHLAFAAGVAITGAVFTIRERVYETDAANLSNSQVIGYAFSDTMLATVAISIVAVVLSTQIKQPESV